MSAEKVRRALGALGVVLLAVAVLAACASGAVSDGGSGDVSDGAQMVSGVTTDAEGAVDAGTSAAIGALTVLAGTGTYAIGTEAPLGSYELSGNPDALPAGCRWAIEDADGQTFVAGDVTYVFLTEVPEAVTFVTTGCPDWHRYE